MKKPSLGANCTFDFYHAIVEMNTHQLFDMGAWSKLYHKSLFDNLRFPVGKFSEDYYIMFKIFDRAQWVSYLDTPCYNYLQRNNSITRSTKINHDHESAAREQMIYLDKKYPELRIVSHTSYASAALTVYDFYIKNHVSCPKEELQHFRDVVNKNKKYIEQADYLSKSKKIQFSLFMISPYLYRTVFRVYRRIKRI